MSQSSAQRIQTPIRNAVKAAPLRHLRALRRPAGPRIETWHVLAVTLAVACAAVCLAIALRPERPVEATVSWIALPDVPVPTSMAHAVSAPVEATAPVASGGCTPAALVVAAAAPAAEVHDRVAGRPAPAARHAGSSMFDDPDAKEDLTVGRALSKDAKPTDHVTKDDFRKALAAMNGGAQ